MAKRICIYCGKEISFLQSILHNNTCSYECDMALEKESKKEKKNEQKKNIKYEESGTINIDLDESEPVIEGAIVDEDDTDDFYEYCLTDDNDKLDDDYSTGFEYQQEDDDNNIEF